MLLRGALDPALDLPHLVGIVLAGIVLVINIGPSGPNMLRRIDWILIVHWVGELDIAIFVLALFGIHVVAAIDSLLTVPARASCGERLST